MITCKRLYDETSQADGYRILVDRLWPRGVKKEALAAGGKKGGAGLRRVV